MVDGFWAEFGQEVSLSSIADVELGTFLGREGKQHFLSTPQEWWEGPSDFTAGEDFFDLWDVDGTALQDGVLTEVPKLTGCTSNAFSQK